MEQLAVDDVENDIQPAAVMRHLTKPIGLTDFAMNYYELEPGDSFAFAYHEHELQEEVFYIISGTATFDTEDGSVDVGPKEAIRFDRQEFQRGWNRGDERVTALAFGAPLEYGGGTMLRYCENCGEQTENSIESADDEEALYGVCDACGTETGRWHRGSMEGEVP